MPCKLSPTEIVKCIDWLILIFSLDFRNEMHAKIIDFWDHMMLVVLELSPILGFFTSTHGVAFQQKLLCKIMLRRNMIREHYMSISDCVSALLENLRIHQSSIIEKFLLATDPRAKRELPVKIANFFEKHSVTLPPRLRRIQIAILVCAYQTMTRHAEMLTLVDDSDDEPANVESLS
jgi:hypothetical protein